MSPRVSWASGERYNAQGVPFRPESVRVPLLLVVGAVIARAVGRLAVSVMRRPLLWGPGLVLLAALWLLGPVGLVALMVVVAAGLAVWSRTRRESFRRIAGLPARGLWRHVWVYRRNWQPAMVTCGLDARVVDRQYLPQLVRVAATGSVDRVRLRMLPGQVLDDYAERADRLAMSLGAAECRVRTGKRHGEVELWLLVDDPLGNVVPVFDPPQSGGTDFAGLPVARAEDGDTYRLKLQGNHVLAAGATGSGKGSVLWSITWALQTAVLDGSAQLWVCDPKGGMEFASGAPMFARYVYGDTNPQDESASYEAAFAEFFEAAVVVMRERQSRLRGVTRLHEPTPADPLVVVFVDELASLTAYVSDRDARNRIKAALSLLLSQGRAVGVVVIAALQDPRKDVLPFRDLFPTRIALRLTEPEQVDMTLGDGSRRRGAACDRIPEHLPGVGYVVLDGVAEPIRVRFPFISDDHITDMAMPDPVAQVTHPRAVV